MSEIETQVRKLTEELWGGEITDDDMTKPMGLLEARPDDLDIEALLLVCENHFALDLPCDHPETLRVLCETIQSMTTKKS